MRTEWEYCYLGLCHSARYDYNGRPIQLTIYTGISKLDFAPHPGVTVGIMAYLPGIVWDQNVSRLSYVIFQRFVSLS